MIYENDQACMNATQEILFPFNESWAQKADREVSWHISWNNIKSAAQAASSKSAAQTASSQRIEKEGERESSWQGWKQAKKHYFCSESSRREEEKEEKQSARLESKPGNVKSVAVGARKERKESSRRGWKASRETSTLLP